jgi:peptidoglycan/LPS O-acetylase OafA/YrhL
MDKVRPFGSAAAAPHRPGRIAALDGLRGVAALMVLLHHVLLTLPDFANAEWRVPGATTHGVVEWLLIRTPLELAWSGEARALLFFVLSGFVLALPWLDGRNLPYGSFLLHRFCRIYPPYIIAMAAAAAASFALGGHRLANASIFFNQLGWAFPISWKTIPSVVAVLDNQHSRYLNEAIWSLVWEVRVAFIFPLLMLPVVRWGNRGIALVFATILVLNPVAAHAPSISPPLNDWRSIFYFAQFFMLGVTVAANRSTIAAWFARQGPASGPLLLAAACVVCWIPWPIEDERMVALGAAGVLAVAAGSAPVQSWLSARPLLWLGQQSYSLYLTHLLVIMTTVILFRGAVPVWACVAMVPACIVLAWAYRRWVEIPSVALAQQMIGRAPIIREPPGPHGGARSVPAPRLN